jgi:hypothetical protein
VTRGETFTLIACILFSAFAFWMAFAAPCERKRETMAGVFDIGDRCR